MLKFTICLFAALSCSFVVLAQNQVVYRMDDFQNNPPENFDSRIYETLQSDAGTNDRRIVEETGNVRYEFVRFSNSFDFRPADLGLDVTMSVSVYFGQSGDVRYVVYWVRKRELTDKGFRYTDFELPQAVENKFRRIFGEFANQYKSNYKSLKPFKIQFGVDLKKQPRRPKPNSINSLEVALATMQPDTVKELNFSGLDLKNIPEVVYRFKNLEQLELSNNYLTSLPAEITKLKKLKYLGLDFNDFTNDSVAFSRNRNLKVLRLQHNPITTLPESVRKNKKLEDLLIGNNKLSDLKTASFRGLKKLKTLNLYNVQIEELPQSVKRLKRLEIIDLYHNDLRFLPEKFYKLKRLQTLAVSHNRLWKLPEDISRMKRLNTLYTHHNKLSTLPELPESLVLLHFDNNRFKDFPKEVIKLPNLESIDFSSNEIELLPAELLQLPKLKNVYMMGNEYNRKKELFDDVDRFVVDLEGKNITVR